MLYTILWNEHRSYQLIGHLDAVLQLANMLENKKILFSVADTRGFRLNQKDLGCGDFAYWQAA